MGLVELLIMLSIGAIAGWLSGNIMRGGGFGLIGNVVTGLVGSIVGTFIGGMISPVLGLNLSGLVGTLIWATIGACITLFISGILKKNTGTASTPSPYRSSSAQTKTENTEIIRKFKAGLASGTGGAVAYVVTHSIFGFGIPEASIASFVAAAILGFIGFTA